MTNRPNLRPGWRWARLEEVASFFSRTVPDPANSEYDRFVSSEHIDRFEMKVRRWGPSSEVASSKKGFEAGDYLFVARSLYGSDFRERASRADFSGVCSNGILVLRERPGVLAEGFLGVILNQSAIWDFVVRNATGTLTRYVYWKTLKDYEFALPPLEEQRRIATTLQALNGFLHAIEEAAAAAKCVGDAFDEEFFATAPSTWPRAPVSALCEFYSRRHGATEKEFEVSGAVPGAVPVLRSLNVWPGRFDLSDLRYISPEGNAAEAKLQLRENDVLIVRTGDAGRPGNAAVVPKAMAGWNCLDLILARPRDAVLAGYLEAALNRSSSLQRLTSLAPGTKQKHLTMTELHRVQIPVPPLMKQASYLDQRASVRRAGETIEHRRAIALQTQKVLRRSLECNDVQ